MAEVGASLSTSARFWACATVVGTGPAGAAPHGRSSEVTSPRQTVSCWVSYTLPALSSQVSVHASRLPALYSKGRVEGVTIQSNTPLAGTVVLYSSLSSTGCAAPGEMQSSASVLPPPTSLGPAIAQTGLV